MENDQNIGKYLSRIQRLQLKYMKPMFESLGIAPSCFSFILNIHYHPGISQKQICEITKHDEAIATRLIKQMEKNGFVKKERNPKDHRAFQLYLTERGETLFPQIQSKLDAWWEVMLEDMPVELLDQALSTMTSRAILLANIEKEKINHG